MKFLLVGGGGREAAFAMRLAEDSTVYAVMGHENPTIIQYVKDTGGAYMVGDHDDPDTVVKFAIQHEIDYTFVNADQPLCNGVVDRLLDSGIKAVGGTRAATRVEWDKIYGIQMMNQVAPEFTPSHTILHDPAELEDAMGWFRKKNLQVVVKPQGLTGGKGVKVMPEHLPTYDDCMRYASELLGRGEGVLLVERLEGIEFTIMGLTDGVNLVLAPASYDYPYRYEGDRGPGTGGMGCFTSSEATLPFMDKSDLDDCRRIMQCIIDEIRQRGLQFSGVLNGGFFKTVHGIRFMEFNARFGDPEVLNTLLTLEGSFSEIIIRMWEKRLSKESVSFIKKASVVKYLVAGEYPEKSPAATNFTIHEEAIKDLGVQVYFASCVGMGGCRYSTLQKSRVVAFGAIADEIPAAARIVDMAIDRHVSGPLEFRRDIGSKENLKGLSMP